MTQSTLEAEDGQFAFSMAATRGRIADASRPYMQALMRIYEYANYEVNMLINVQSRAFSTHEALISSAAILKSNMASA